MSKFTSIFLITLALFFFFFPSSTIEARLPPAVSPTHYNPTHHHHHHAPAPSPTVTKSSDGEEEELVDVSENCAGVGEEECLMRRSLEANIDYIYTNHTAPPLPFKA